MKIPIFEEIILTEFHYPYLVSLFKNSRVGQVPTFVNLTNFKKTDLIALIQLIEEVFDELNIHPRFPYPTYFICTHTIETKFPLVTSIKLLPDHFFKKVKRPNNKELQLINKLGLKVDKLNNLDKNKILNDFSKTNHSQRQLYSLTKELYFLEVLYQQLFEKPKFNKPVKK